MISFKAAKEAHDLVKRDFQTVTDPNARTAASLSLSVLCWVIDCREPDCPPRFDLMIATIKNRPKVVQEIMRRAKANQN
jgi:hypothetical protein